jgi:hypothetical protein
MPHTHRMIASSSCSSSGSGSLETALPPFPLLLLFCCIWPTFRAGAGAGRSSSLFLVCWPLVALPDRRISSTSSTLSVCGFFGSVRDVWRRKGRSRASRRVLRRRGTDGYEGAHACLPAIVVVVLSTGMEISRQMSWGLKSLSHVSHL